MTGIIIKDFIKCISTAMHGNKHFKIRYYILMKQYDFTKILAVSHLCFHLFMIKSKSSPVVSASPLLRRPANRRVSEMKPSPAPGLRQSPSLHRWSLITPPDDLCHPIVLPATQNSRGFVSSRMPGQRDEHISCSCPLQTTWNKNMTNDCNQGHEIRPGGHAHNGRFPLQPSALASLMVNSSSALFLSVQVICEKIFRSWFSPTLLGDKAGRPLQVELQQAVQDCAETEGGEDADHARNIRLHLRGLLVQLVQEDSANHQSRKQAHAKRRIHTALNFWEVTWKWCWGVIK